MVDSVLLKKVACSHGDTRMCQIQSYTIHRGDDCFHGTSVPVNVLGRNEFWGYGLL